MLVSLLKSQPVAVLLPGRFAQTVPVPPVTFPALLPLHRCAPLRAVLGRGYNHSVDWWTLGVLMYVLLTARQPFSSPKTHDPMEVGTMDVIIHLHASSLSCIAVGTHCAGAAFTASCSSAAHSTGVLTQGLRIGHFLRPRVFRTQLAFSSLEYKSTLDRRNRVPEVV